MLQKKKVSEGLFKIKHTVICLNCAAEASFGIFAVNRAMTRTSPSGLLLKITSSLGHTNKYLQ